MSRLAGERERERGRRKEKEDRSRTSRRMHGIHVQAYTGCGRLCSSLHPVRRLPRRWSDPDRGLYRAAEIYEHGKFKDWAARGQDILATDPGTRDLSCIIYVCRSLISPPGHIFSLMLL